MGVSYNRNAGLALDAELALFLVDAGISVRMRSYSDSRLKCDTGFLRPAFKMERGVAQICARRRVLRLALDGMQSYSDSRWMRVYSSPHLKSPCFLGCEVRILVKTQPSRWNEARLWRLILSDFWTAYRTPSKVFEPPRLTGIILKYFEFQLNLGFLWLEWQSFMIPWAWSYLDCGLRECTIELLEVLSKVANFYLVEKISWSM